ncbi:HSF-type DNA-binding-domain-containing protein [Gongronella butleri]|nr:HSF-type DNA-binding-domain-containing protein [Gongronella butleri]
MNYHDYVGATATTNAESSQNSLYFATSPNAASSSQDYLRDSSSHGNEPASVMTFLDQDAPAALQGRTHHAAVTTTTIIDTNHTYPTGVGGLSSLHAWSPLPTSTSTSTSTTTASDAPLMHVPPRHSHHVAHHHPSHHAAHQRHPHQQQQQTQNQPHCLTTAVAMPLTQMPVLSSPETPSTLGSASDWFSPHDPRYTLNASSSSTTSQPLLQSSQPLIDDRAASYQERGVAGFVCKLYESLEAADNGEKYAHWCKHDGKDMFIIDCIPKFTETVLPKLFKHCKFASFVRQLNIYGFQRDTDARKSKDSKEKGSCRWYHTYFRPGRQDLFHLIRRKAPRYSRRKRSPSSRTLNSTGASGSSSSSSVHAMASSSSSSALPPPTLSLDDSDLDDDDQMLSTSTVHANANHSRLPLLPAVSSSLHDLDLAMMHPSMSLDRDRRPPTHSTQQQQQQHQSTSPSHLISTPDYVSFAALHAHDASVRPHQLPRPRTQHNHPSPPTASLKDMAIGAVAAAAAAVGPSMSTTSPSSSMAMMPPPPQMQTQTQQTHQQAVLHDRDLQLTVLRLQQEMAHMRRAFHMEITEAKNQLAIQRQRIDHLERGAGQ